jgi:glutaredoxin
VWSRTWFPVLKKVLVFSKIKARGKIFAFAPSIQSNLGIRMAKALAWLRADLTSYLLEFTCRKSRPDPEILQIIRSAVEQHTIVVFEKPGCGFCRRAKNLLAEHYSDDLATPAHTLTGSTPEFRLALSHALGISSVTFPVIYCNGEYLGGADDLARSHNQETLRVKIQGGHTPMAAFGSGMTKTRPTLCSQLAGSNVAMSNGSCLDDSTSKWYFFQTKSYAQVIRMMSFFHVCIFVIMLACAETNSAGGIAAALIIGVLFMAELVAFVSLGATPLTLFGNLSTWLVWNVKGDAVPAIPYKFVFVVYIFALARMLSTCADPKYESVSHCWQNNTAEYRGGLIGGVVNSGALAAFRF